MFCVGTGTSPSEHSGPAAATVGAAARLAAATMVPPESRPPTTAVAKRNRMITSRMMCPNLSGTHDYTVGYVQ